MSVLKWGIGILGILFLLSGIVFALQGATGIGGGSSMDNNPIWIYIGTAIAIVGAVLALVAYRPRGPAPK